MNRSTRGYLKTNSLNGCDTRGQVLAKMTYGLKRLLLDGTQNYLAIRRYYLIFVILARDLALLCGRCSIRERILALNYPH